MPRGCRGLWHVRLELCDEALERLLSSDFPGGADGGQGQFLVGRGNGRDHGVGLRCGVAGAEPAHDVGFRGVGERRISSRLRRRGRRRRNRREVERRAAYPRSASLSAASSSGVCFLASVPRTIPRPAAGRSAACRFCAGTLAAATALFPAAASRASRAT